MIFNCFLMQGESVLKVQYLADTTPVSKTVDGPTDQELMKMFNTTKHEWKYTYVFYKYTSLALL